LGAGAAAAVAANSQIDAIALGNIARLFIAGT
jgi:hypothetical protein